MARGARRGRTVGPELVGHAGQVALPRPKDGLLERDGGRPRWISCHSPDSRRAIGGPGRRARQTRGMLARQTPGDGRHRVCLAQHGPCLRGPGRVRGARRELESGTHEAGHLRPWGVGDPLQVDDPVRFAQQVHPHDAVLGRGVPLVARHGEAPVADEQVVGVLVPRADVARVAKCLIPSVSPFPPDRPIERRHASRAGGRGLGPRSANPPEPGHRDADHKQRRADHERLEPPAHDPARDRAEDDRGSERRNDQPRHEQVPAVGGRLLAVKGGLVRREAAGTISRRAPRAGMDLGATSVPSWARRVAEDAGDRAQRFTVHAAPAAVDVPSRRAGPGKPLRDPAPLLEDDLLVLRQAGREACLAEGEVVLPHPDEAVVEAHAPRTASDAVHERASARLAASGRSAGDVLDAA